MRTVASRSPAPLFDLQALALEAEGAARIGAGGNRQFHRAVERRHAHLAAEHRLVKRDRQFEPQIGAVRLNSGCGATCTVISASPALPLAIGQPWPLQADRLAVGEAGRNFRPRRPCRSADARASWCPWRPPASVMVISACRSCAARRLGEILRLELPAEAAPAAARGAAEHVAQNVLEAAAAAAAAAPPRALEAVGPEGEALEMRARRRSRRRRPAAADAFEALEARLALGVDLAVVEGLALLVVADDLVGRIELGETRGRLRVVLVGVGMQLLGELAGRRS